MKRIPVLLCFFAVALFQLDSQGLKLHYAFNLQEAGGLIVDETGSGRHATLSGSAVVRKLGAFGIAETGSTAGYVQMSAAVGEIISTLADFTIATYVYVDPAQSVSPAGNFIWTFANSANMSSTANGSMFFTARETRYAISPTNWTAEQKVNPAAAFPKGNWKHVAYVQSGNTGTIYLNGVSIKSGTVSLKPSDLGATAYNFLFKSPYASDALLLNSKMCDFRLYDNALTVNQLQHLAANTQKLDTLLFTEQVQLAADALNPGDLSAVKRNLYLPVMGLNSTTISWSSSNSSVISNEGYVHRPAIGSEKVSVVLTATITRNFVSAQRVFEAVVEPIQPDEPVEESYTGYLFAYFTGNNISQEAIRFAWSTNGLAWKALNNNQPVIASANISRTGGVRDPHILRGEDGWFYMVVTDMVSANGWNSNRGMVLLKSANLIDWTSATVHIPTAFPAEFGNVDRVWAPQTIYDPEVGKYMIYFSMRKGSTDYDKIYYAYANSTFTALETVPKQLFFNPAMTACIDGDIVYHQGKYHLFYKTEGTGNGIKKAVSDKLTGSWEVIDKYLQQTTSGVEGSCVFRLINSDNWVLMYDVYTAGYYQFTQSTDLENFSLISSGVSMDFAPRHGTVIPLTPEELQRVRNRWDPTVEVEEVEAAKPKIFTNSQGEVTVTFSDPVISGSLSVYNLFGRCVFSQQLTSVSESRFKLQEKGVYLVCVQSEEGTQTTRFLNR